MPISRIVSNAAKKQIVGKMTSAAVASRTPVKIGSAAQAVARRAVQAPLSHPSPSKKATSASSTTTASSSTSSPDPKLVRAARESIETQRILPGHDEEIDSVEADGVLETEEETMMMEEMGDDDDGNMDTDDNMDIEIEKEDEKETDGQMQRSQAMPKVQQQPGGGAAQQQQRGNYLAAAMRPPPSPQAASLPSASASAAASAGLVPSSRHKALSSRAFVNSIVATRNGTDAVQSRPAVRLSLGVANPLAALARPELPSASTGSPSPTSVSASASAKQAAAPTGAASQSYAAAVASKGTKKAALATGTTTAKLSITAPPPSQQASSKGTPDQSPTRRSKRRISISTKVAENDETRLAMETMAAAGAAKSAGTGGKARASSLQLDQQPTPRTTNGASSSSRILPPASKKRQLFKSSNRKPSGGGGGGKRRNTSSPQPGGGVIAAAAVTLTSGGGIHHVAHNHPAVSMQPPISNPNSVAPSPLLVAGGSSAASGLPNNGNGGGGRARIFSIDLDAAGIDFGLGPSDGLLPMSARKSTLEEEPSSSSNATRLRGMSFELFSFGIGGGDDILPPAASSNTIMATDASGRPRGDSIIFDPVSFCDGGIHETNALTKVRSSRTSIDEVDIMNSPGFVEAPILDVKPKHPGPPKRSARSRSPKVSFGRRSHANSLDGIMPTPSQLTVSAPNVDDVSYFFEVSREDAAASAAKLNGLTAAAVSYTRSSCQPVPQGPFSGNAINLPHGSCAAAAAKDIPKSILPKPSSPTNGGSTMSSTAAAIGHINCPVELFNKGGRIGIYLPEARKARIAKFHSTRKNRVWRKRIKYDCRKKLADSRPRIKGRFVKRIDEL